MRIFEPASKLRSRKLLCQYFNKELSYKQILTMMDYVSREEKFLKKRIAGSILRSFEDIDILLFDVTTLHFEAVRSDDLRDFGYSKDGKFNEVQLVLAVLSTSEEQPLLTQCVEQVLLPKYK